MEAFDALFPSSCDATTAMSASIAPSFAAIEASSDSIQAKSGLLSRFDEPLSRRNAARRQHSGVTKDSTAATEALSGWKIAFFVAIWLEIRSLCPMIEASKAGSASPVRLHKEWNEGNVAMKALAGDRERGGRWIFAIVPRAG